MITFLANGTPEQARLRVRQVPPFDPVQYEYQGYHAQANRTYHIRVARQQAQLSVQIDDQPPHQIDLAAAGAEQGYLGFRTWRTRLWWDNLTVTAAHPALPVE